MPQPQQPATPAKSQAAIAVSAAGTMQLAAGAVGAIAAAKREEAHAAKVKQFIERQTKLHPDAPRILYGRDHSGSLTDHQIQMNAEALALLNADPSLIRFEG
eukprot:7391391-Prymnesium_polylepis.1